MLKNHKVILIVCGVVFSFAWGGYTVHELIKSSLTKNTNHPALQVVRAASPDMGTPAATFAPRKKTSFGRARYSRPAATATPTAAPVVTMSSTSMRLHETGKAVVQTAGNNQSVQPEVLGLGQSHRAKMTEVSSSSVSNAGMLAMSTAQAITAVGAGNANSVAKIAPASLPKRRKTTTDGEYPVDPTDPVPDENDPVPAGPVPFLMMALLAASYAITIACRARARRQAK